MTTELIQLTNQPKTEEVVTVISAEPIAESGTSVTRDFAPRPTPQNTGRAGRWLRKMEGKPGLISGESVKDAVVGLHSDSEEESSGSLSSGDFSFGRFFLRNRYQIPQKGEISTAIVPKVPTDSQKLYI